MQSVHLAFLSVCTAPTAEPWVDGDKDGLMAEIAANDILMEDGCWAEDGQ